MNSQMKKYYNFLESLAPRNETLVRAVIEATQLIFENNEQQPQQPQKPEENLPPVEPQPQEQQPAPAPESQQQAPTQPEQPQQQQPAPEQQMPGTETAADVEKNVEKIATQQPSSFREVAPTYKTQITDMQKIVAGVLPQIAAYTSKNPADKEALKYQELLTQSAKSISQLAGYTARAGQVQQTPPAPQQQQQAPQQAPMQ